MCDPITAITLGGAALSAAGSLYEGAQAAAGYQDVIDKQNAANANWLAYQQQARTDAQAAEDAARQKADAARTDTLAKVGPDAQAQQQTTEQQRLNTLYTSSGVSPAQDPNNVQGMLLSGEGVGNRTDTSGITAQINNATAQARQRIAALATANSYGGSFGGLGTVVPLEFQQGGNAINLQNNMRQGNIKTYGVEQQVQPLQYAVGPGTIAQAGLAKSLGSIAGTLAGAGGTKALGSLGSWGSTAAGSVATDAGGALDPELFNTDFSWMQAPTDYGYTSF